MHIIRQRKCFLTLHACQPVVRGLPKPKYEPFITHNRGTLIDGLEWCRSFVDYCDVFISCLDSHSDGTHSLQRIHWWASDVMLNSAAMCVCFRQQNVEALLKNMFEGEKSEVCIVNGTQVLLALLETRRPGWVTQTQTYFISHSLLLKHVCLCITVLSRWLTRALRDWKSLTL